jgi:hypothetical protein
MLNTSNRLDWTTFAAPVLNEYMARMMAAGYMQTYRKNILQKSIAIYDRMIKDDAEGIVPDRRAGDQKKDAGRNKGKSTTGQLKEVILPQ